MRFRSPTLAAATLALALTACSDGGDEGDRATPREESSSAEQTTSEAPPTEEQTSGTASSAPTSRGPDPADGQEVLTAGVAMRLPSDLAWEVPPPVDRGGATLTQAAHVDGGEEWTVTILEDEPTIPASDLAAGSVQGAKAQYRRVKQRPERTIDGVQAYVTEAIRPVEATGAQADDFYYEVGVSLANRWVTVGFRAPERSPATRSRIESMVATISWQ